MKSRSLTCRGGVAFSRLCPFLGLEIVAAAMVYVRKDAGCCGECNTGEMGMYMVIWVNAIKQASLGRKKSSNIDKHIHISYFSISPTPDLVQVKRHTEGGHDAQALRELLKRDARSARPATFPAPLRLAVALDPVQTAVARLLVVV